MLFVDERLWRGLLRERDIVDDEADTAAASLRGQWVAERGYIFADPSG